MTLADLRDGLSDGLRDASRMTGRPSRRQARSEPVTVREAATRRRPACLPGGAEVTAVPTGADRAGRKVIPGHQAAA